MNATSAILVPDFTEFKFFGITFKVYDVYAVANGEYWSEAQTHDNPASDGFITEEIKLDDFAVEIPLIKKFFGEHVHKDICEKVVFIPAVEEIVKDLAEQFAANGNLAEPEPYDDCPY